MKPLVLLALMGSACASPDPARTAKELGVPDPQAQYQGITASHIGCPPSEIAISDASGPSWTAECRGKRWFCSVVGMETQTVSCAPDLGASPVPAAEK
jgi:hypothetical protein